MTYKIGQRVPIVVTRTESNFDRACERAYFLALDIFGHDEFGSFLFVENSHRSEDSIKVKFLKYNITGGMMGVIHSYKFEAWIEKYKEK